MDAQTLRELQEQFGWQVDSYIDRGYPQAIGMPVDEFKAYVHPLMSRLDRVLSGGAIDIPFLLVIPSEVVPLEQQYRLLCNGRPGRFPFDPAMTGNADALMPRDPYLLVGITKDEGWHDMTAEELRDDARERSVVAMTIEEGIALDLQVRLGHAQVWCAGSWYGRDEVPVLVTLCNRGHGDLTHRRMHGGKSTDSQDRICGRTYAAVARVF